MTGQELITAALRKLNVISANEEPTSADVAEALSAFNGLMSSKSNTFLNTHKVTPLRYPLQAGKQVYTVGPTGDWVTTRPIRIEEYKVILNPVLPEQLALDVTVEVDGFNATFTAAGPEGLYQWEFGDGSTDVGPIVTHTYATAGTFTYTLNFLSATQQGTATGQVNPTAPPFVPYLDTFSFNSSLADHTADSGQTYLYYIYPGNPIVGDLSNYTISGGYVTNTIANNPSGSAQPSDYTITNQNLDCFFEITVLLPFPFVLGTRSAIYSGLFSSGSEYLQVEVTPDEFFENTTVYVYTNDYAVDNYINSASFPVGEPTTIRVELTNGFTQCRVLVNGAQQGGVTTFSTLVGKELFPQFAFDTNAGGGTRSKIGRIEFNTL